MNKIVTAVMIPLTLGLIYIKIGDEAPPEFDQQYLLKIAAFWFMGIYFVFALNIFDTALACKYDLSQSQHKEF